MQNSYIYSMNDRFIAIEGNIGAGKTTLALQLAKHFDAALLLEQFAENPFLPLFYQNKKQYALPLELSFLRDRYQQLQTSLKELQYSSQMIVADYSIYKSPLFAKNNLDEQEFELYSSIHDMIKTTLPKPDLFIYLHTPVSKLQHRIKERGRPYEQQIQDDYLQEIEAAYLQFFQKETDNLLLIDNTHADLNEPEQFDRLVKYIESGQPLPKGMTRLH